MATQFTLDEAQVDSLSKFAQGPIGLSPAWDALVVAVSQLVQKGPMEDLLRRMLSKLDIDFPQPIIAEGASEPENDPMQDACEYVLAAIALKLIDVAELMEAAFVGMKRKTRIRGQDGLLKKFLMAKQFEMPVLNAQQPPLAAQGSGMSPDGAQMEARCACLTHNEGPLCFKCGKCNPILPQGTGMPRDGAQLGAQCACLTHNEGPLCLKCGKSNPILPDPQFPVLCQWCGMCNSKHAKFCRGCGSALGAPGITCQSCLKSNPANAKFCLGCGMLLAANVAVITCSKCKMQMHGEAFCSQCGTAAPALPSQCFNCSKCKMPLNGVPFCSQCGTAAPALPPHVLISPHCLQPPMWTRRSEIWSRD